MIEMEFYTDLKKFQELCVLYRQAFAINDINTYEKYREEILNLINFNVQRLQTYFKLHISKQTTKLDKGKGIPLVAMSINKILQKQNSLRFRDLTTLNPRSVKQLDGVSIMLDHSGSMWFNSRYDNIGDIQRIYAQNFLALILINYTASVSKNKIKITINCFCQESVITECLNINNENIDTFLPNSDWGNMGEIKIKSKEIAPLKFQSFAKDFYLRENLPEALQESLLTFKKSKMNNFITLFFTDGGLHRIGESKEDRVKYLKDFVYSLNSFSKRTEVLFTFIKTQVFHTVELLKEVNIKHHELNDIDSFNLAFDKFTSIINEMRN